MQLRPCGAGYVGTLERHIFCSTTAPKVRMENTALRSVSGFAHRQQDRHALLNVEYIFVFAPVRRDLLLLRVAVQIVDVNLIEAAHQVLAHSAKGWVVQITVVRDEGQDSVIWLHGFKSPLCEANELHIVVLQPLRIPLPKARSVYPLVVLN